MLSFMGLVNIASDVCYVALMYDSTLSLYRRSTVVIANTISLFAGCWLVCIASRSRFLHVDYPGSAVTRL